MRRLLVLGALLACGALGCANTVFNGARRPDAAYRAVSKIAAPVIPPPGVLYGDVRAPLAIGPTHFGPRKGTATSSQIGLPPLPFAGLAQGLDLFAWGDASLDAAAAEGGISKVEHTDYRLETYFFVYRRFTVEAYGE